MRKFREIHAGRYLFLQKAQQNDEGKTDALLLGFLTKAVKHSPSILLGEQKLGKRLLSLSYGGISWDHDPVA